MDNTAKSTLRHLRAFQMVARLHNIRRAAEAVHLTQPAVTLAIAKLECQAEALLFDRQSRGTHATAMGEILLARIDRMFGQIDAALAAAGARHAHGAPLADRITRAQVRALCAVCRGDMPEDGADGIARASIHRTVREMERLLGIALLQPVAGGVTATQAGTDLAQRLVVALAEVDYGLAEIAVEQRRAEGVLRIGAMPMTGSFVVGPVLNDLATVCTGARLEVKTGDSGHLSRALLRGEIDLIVGLLREMAEGIEQEPLVELPYVLVARRGHPLAGRNRLEVVDLEGFDWVAPNPGTARRVAFDRVVSGMARAPVANIQASSLSTLRLLVSGSDRLALLTRFEFEQERPDGVLTDLAFDVGTAHWLGIASRRDWLPTPLHRKFIDLVRQRADRIADRARVAVALERELA